MSARGVHFALSEQDTALLLDASSGGNDTLMAFVETIESRWDKDWLQETDKSWDAIHRCLTDGKLEWGDTPFHNCVLGKGNLFQGDDYLMNFLDLKEVAEVAAAIRHIDEADLRRRYDAIDASSYGALSDEDFEYTWSWFSHLRDFFQKAAADNRTVLFTVDQ